MQGGKDPMTRQGCLDGDAGGFFISYFTYQDDIRIVSKNSAQSTSKGQTRFLGYLNLVDPRI